MKRFMNWQILLALALVVLSVIFYLIHYIIFRDVHHIFLYLIGDIAFLFVDVLIVMLVLHRLLVYREKQSILKKLNMAIGTFFSEMGTELLTRFSRADPELADIGQHLVVTKDWTDRDFAGVRRAIKNHNSAIDSGRVNFEETKNFLLAKRAFLLTLLENPNLLEHESFTDLLWAVFHLTDELAHRTGLKELGDSDREHLAGDIKRAYHQLLVQWIDYMKHLKRDYPYLFSLAIRTNPFDAEACIEVK